ncbi:MAG: glycyl-tRNA synthetase [Dehalococcoidia bacterium]|nr:glycyl-tRNA synthetase [Dehalococcoidia bacterium]MBF8304296.1 glycyl-tRNA synthetase [Dehalococcoidia bacterium]
MPRVSTKPVDMDTIVSLCKRRGYVFPSSEIYGGLGSAWDYGPLGVELKRNIKNAWWQANIQERDDVVGLDSAIILNPQAWVASGHVQGFSDPLVDCKACHMRWRLDAIKDGKCPSCGGEVTEPRQFNLMFKTFAGPVEEAASVVYLRPETAQGIFLNFQNVLTTTRRKLPFGIAQIGKSFRNEITPGNFIFRTREFEQMEIEYFVKPGEDEKLFQDWLKARFNWYLNLGMRKENLRLRQHGKDELAHYARDCYDVEYLFPMGWSELEGIANRGDFDLKQHSKHSGKDLSYFDEEAKQHYFPYVIEPSAGADRSALAFLIDAYDEEEVKGEKRAILRLHPTLAPIKVAILPLSRNNEEMNKQAKNIYSMLRKSWMVQYDDAQSIGRRYRRQDEIGTPFAVTIDFQSLEDKMVTIRSRDSMAQIRVPIATLSDTLKNKLDGEAIEVLPVGGVMWKSEEKAGS